jgi:hypothetical protein
MDEEYLDELLREFKIEDIILTDCNLDLLVLPAEEDSPSWLS